MNRLLAKIRDFGIVLTPDGTEPQKIIDWAKALKRAHIPLVLLPAPVSGQQDIIKLANENVDLFIGSDCLNNFDSIEPSFSSGAHFAICNTLDTTRSGDLKNRGIEFFVRVSSHRDIDQACGGGATAIVINTGNPDYEKLIGYSIEKYDFPFFLEGSFMSSIISKWRNNPSFIALITYLPHSHTDHSNLEIEGFKLIQSFLGLRYKALYLKEKSVSRKEGQVFTAMSAIPLFEGADEDCLEIETGDMDRTVAHWKWRNIYMDPLTARMDGNKIKSTLIYDDFLGWPIRLVEAD